jgi:hypothetical protein
LLAIVVMVLLMTVLVTSGAFAQEAAPEEGPAIGEHVSSVAPEHPLEHGNEGEVVPQPAEA